MVEIEFTVIVIIALLATIFGMVLGAQITRPNH